MLLGAATAQAGFRRKIGRDATWVALLAGDSPDIDVIPSLFRLFHMEGAPAPYWTEHRGITHSLLAIPLLALLVAVPWWLARRAVRRRQQALAVLPANGPPVAFGWLFACALTAAFTHPILDFCTSYGTMLLAPFSDRRFAADAVGILDLIFTSTLLLAVLTSALLRWRRPNGRAPLVAVCIGLTLCTAYVLTGRALHNRAVALAVASVNDGQRVLRAEAYPAIGTIFLWRAVVRTEHRWHVFRVHFLAPEGQRIRNSTSVWQETADPWIAKALDTPQARRFDWFCGGLMRSVCAAQDGRHVVTFHDMRYGLPLESADSIFALQVELDSAGAVKTARLAHDAPSGRRQRMLLDVWRDLWNP